MALSSALLALDIPVSHVPLLFDTARSFSGAPLVESLIWTLMAFEEPIDVA